MRKRQFTSSVKFLDCLIFLQSNNSIFTPITYIFCLVTDSKMEFIMKMCTKWRYITEFLYVEEIAPIDIH